MPNNINWPDWDVINCIGKGGFGAVYEIRREVFGDIERSALKVITIPKDSGEIEYMRCEGMDDDSITSTLHSQVGDIINEYKLMMRMRENPNIVHCDDFRYTRHENDLGWDIYIKMELLTPLLKVLDRMNDEKEIVRLGIELCNALSACQKHNIIHRDIKPQNIFISPEGFYKLGDFGIARTMEHTTKATAGIGTYSFMAPEVALGKSYGPTVDIYSLGLVLYWLLNEKRGPFVPLPPENPTYADKELAYARRYAGEPIPAPKNGHELLKSVVLKACAFSPEERYRTAEEMMAALEYVQKLFEDGTGVWTDGVEETVIDENESSNTENANCEDHDDKGSDENVTVYDEDTILTEEIIQVTTDEAESGQSVVATGNNTPPEVPGDKPKRKMWPWVTLALAMAAIIAVILLPKGWKNVDNDYYYYRMGIKAKGKVIIDGDTYFFDSEGTMRTGWLELDGQKYYFGTDGKMVTGIRTINGEQYYLDGNGVMQSGWIDISEKKYYYGADGKLVPGNWKEENGNTYYYKNGTKLTGSQTIDGDQYYFDANGVMQTGWIELSGSQYYYDAYGKMVTGEHNINSEICTFDNHGKLFHKMRILNGSEIPSSKNSSDDTYYKRNNGKTGKGKYQILSKPIENCSKITVTVEISNLKAGTVDEWGFYIRDLNGKWTRVGGINVSNNKSGSETFNFDSLVSFDAYVCFCESLGNYWEFNFSQTLSNIEVNELF